MYQELLFNKYSVRCIGCNYYGEQSSNLSCMYVLEGEKQQILLAN